MSTLEHNSTALLGRLGRYDLLLPIGSGGMASIFLGRIAGPAGFEKPVALKVIHSHLVEDPEFVQMFFNEARIAAQLQHPNILGMFELSESNGIYYLAMEYLDGETVRTVGRRAQEREKRGLKARLACSLLMQACEGLHFAHEMRSIKGEPMHLVHRDISPQNLFVTYAGSVKLMDFGIARAAGMAHSTRPGSLKGKFPYMSPEQVKGLELDRRSDIFSLATVLWELLSGRRLFKGRNDFESLRLVGEAKVPPLTSVRSDLPGELDQVLARALAADRRDRYATALELHADLARVVHSLGQSVTTHEIAEQMRAWFSEDIQKKQRILAQLLPQDGSGYQQAVDAAVATASLAVGVFGCREIPSGVHSVWRPEDKEEAEGGGQANGTSASDWRAPDDSNSGDLSSDGDDGQATRWEIDLLAEREGRRQRTGWLGLLGVLAGIGGALFLWLWLSGTFGGQTLERKPVLELQGEQPVVDTAQAPDTPLSVPPSESRVPERTGPVEPVAEPTVEARPPVRLEIEVSPPGVGAQVFVNGELQEDPSNILRDASLVPVKVRVTAPRFRSADVLVVPDRDQNVAVALRPLGRRVAVQKAPAGSPPAAVPAADKQPGRSKRSPEGGLVSNPYAPE